MVFYQLYMMILYIYVILSNVTDNFHRCIVANRLVNQPMFGYNMIMII